MIFVQIYFSCFLVFVPSLYFFVFCRDVMLADVTVLVKLRYNRRTYNQCVYMNTEICCPLCIICRETISANNIHPYSQSSDLGIASDIGRKHVTCLYL